jgi:hypothetical protein
MGLKLGLLTEGVWEHSAEKIFGTKGDEVTGGSRKLHNEELHNLYSLPNIIRRLSCAGHVARMRRNGMHTGFWWEARMK